jgi:hypothetical protein
LISRKLTLLAIAACSVSAMASICSSAAAAKLPIIPPQSQMLGQAFLNKPVSSGTVRLYSLQGKTLPRSAASDRTSRDGLFTVKPKQLPDDFLVVVTGGRVGKAPLRGRLMTVVENYGGTTNIGVSGATTLVASYVLSHPRQAVDAAADHVTDYLDLPQGFGEAAGLSFDDVHFSESAFVKRARAGGGINAYVSHVVNRIDQHKTLRSFVPRRNVQFIGEVLAGISAIIKIYKFSTCTAERKSVELGCVVEAFDGKDKDSQATLDALAGIHDQLVGVSNQISQLQTQLSDQIDGLRNSVLQTQWNQVINSFQNEFYGPIGAAYTDLMVATDIHYQSSDRDKAAAAAKIIIAELRNHDADVTMARTLLPQAGATGALAQFSDLVRAQAGRFFATSSRYWGNGYAGLIQDEWQFFQSWQAKLTYLLIEGDNAEGYSKLYVDEHVIQPFLGVPAAEAGGTVAPVPPAQKGQAACSDKPVRVGKNCQGYLDQESEAVGSPLQPGLVIDTKTGLMWAQQVWNYNDDSGLQNLGPRGSLTFANNLVRDVYNGPYTDWGSFKNWHLPSEGELRSLFDGNTAGAGGLRAALSNVGGFYQNPPDQAGHQPLERFGNSSYVWTSSTSGGKPVQGYFPTGAIGPSDQLGNVIVVRSLSPCERYYYDTSKAAPPLCP